jgi:hypothetical protein
VQNTFRPARRERVGDVVSTSFRRRNEMNERRGVVQKMTIYQTISASDMADAFSPVAGGWRKKSPYTSYKMYRSEEYRRSRFLVGRS